MRSFRVDGRSHDCLRPLGQVYFACADTIGYYNMKERMRVRDAAFEPLRAHRHEITLELQQLVVVL